jgi:aspartate aminotransferase
MYLLENAHVGSVGGVSFGSPECLRFSYAASEADLREAVRRIKKCLQESVIGSVDEINAF